MFNITQFLKDYNIPNQTTGKNCSRGWINIKCPFCDDPSNHGGFDIRESYYNCKRCGYHKLREVLKQLITLNDYQIRKLIKNYQFEGPERFAITKPTSEKPALQACFLPPFSGPLKSYHKDYLIKRNFDPDKLVKIWDLKGTTYDGDYKARIIAPIYFNNQLVSYQGRDITDQSDIRYKACAIENEVIHHKHILYGLDKVKANKVIVVEGITDVWRLGPGSVATFGTGFTNEQVLLLAENFKEVFIMFDDETIEDFTLCTKIAGLGIDSKMLHLPIGLKDPAELTDKQAEKIMEVLR